MSTPPTVAAQVRETHVGMVLLTGDRALKTKKPVRTAFCDFSTPELRRAAIARELELNTRLAPDVYLGTAELTGAGCAEPVLVMRRMPEEKRLATLVRTGADLTEPLRRIARRMAAFHATAPRTPAVTAEGTRDALAERWRHNLDELDPFRDVLLPGRDLDEVRRLVERFLAGRGPLLERRAAESRIVDGHGDLLADDVFCLDDGPRILDCLDFDDRLRAVDALDDICFLAMDLERLGAPDAAEQLVDDYCEFSADPAPSKPFSPWVASQNGLWREPPHRHRYTGPDVRSTSPSTPHTATSPSTRYGPCSVTVINGFMHPPLLCQARIALRPGSDQRRCAQRP